MVNLLIFQGRQTKLNNINKYQSRIRPLIILSILIATSQSCFAASDASHHSKSFLDQFVLSGGIIVWALLLPMSIMTVYQVVNHLMSITRKKLLPANEARVIKKLLSGDNVILKSQKLANNKDMVSIAIYRAINQVGKEKRRGYYRVLVAESLQEQALELMRKIDALNIIGNVAPMIGLFGTVFGMIKAFNGIVEAGGQPRPDQLAGGISLALVTTFWGLLVAIPALTVHGVFKNKIEAIASEAAIECENVLDAMSAHIDGEENKPKSV